MTALAMTYWQTAAVVGLWLLALVLLISLATVWIEEWWDGRRRAAPFFVACLVLVVVVASAAIVLRQDWS